MGGKVDVSLPMSDYLRQLELLTSTESSILSECGLIYPAVDRLHDAILEVVEAIKNQALRDTGVDDIVSQCFDNSRSNWAWDWNKDFKVWRKERGGVVNYDEKNKEA